MSILVRLLIFMVGVRLLMPPGICICKTTEYASKVVVSLTGGQVPESPEDDDHDPGCPASGLSEGMGVQPAGPGPMSLELLSIATVSVEHHTQYLLWASDFISRIVHIPASIPFQIDAVLVI